MKYRWVHDCPRPDMKIGIERVPYTTGAWFWKSKGTAEYQIWETKRVRWTCPECGTSWDWNNSNKYCEGNWWLLDRPEVWKDYR